MFNVTAAAAVIAALQSVSVTSAPVVEAERAFAADAARIGINASFMRWSEPTAILINRGAVTPVGDIYGPQVPTREGGPTLNWWPNWAGISRSGDLGFTTGGVTVDGRRTGHYFTIWRRQPDGSWLWVYDGASGATAAEVPGPEATPVSLNVSNVEAISAEQATVEVTAIEAQMAQAAALDAKQAHLDLLADGARLYADGLPPATNLAGYEAVLSAWPTTFVFGVAEGGGASAAGDLVWTYGPAAWVDGGADKRGHFVRVWQRQGVGEGRWGLVFAFLRPPPRA